MYRRKGCEILDEGEYLKVRLEVFRISTAMDCSFGSYFVMDLCLYLRYWGVYFYLNLDWKGDVMSFCLMLETILMLDSVLLLIGVNQL